MNKSNTFFTLGKGNEDSIRHIWQLQKIGDKYHIINAYHAGQYLVMAKDGKKKDPIACLRQVASIADDEDVSDMWTLRSIDSPLFHGAFQMCI